MNLKRWPESERAAQASTYTVTSRFDAPALTLKDLEAAVKAIGPMPPQVRPCSWMPRGMAVQSGDVLSVHPEDIAACVTSLKVLKLPDESERWRMLPITISTKDRDWPFLFSMVSEP